MRSIRFFRIFDGKEILEWFFFIMGKNRVAERAFLRDILTGLVNHVGIMTAETAQASLMTEVKLVYA